MHPEKTERLFKEFPELFKREQLIQGFECQDGWFDLICSLEGRIKEHQAQFPDLKNFEVTKVLQKMGGLRIIFSGGDVGIQNLIRKVEEESRSICELDGKPAAGLFVCAPSWFRCLCKRCSELHGYMTLDNYLCEKSIATPIQDQIQHSM